MLPVPRLRFEVEEFLASCEQDLGCAPGTTTFYRKKLASLVTWAETSHTQGLDAQVLREFFRHLKATGLSETTRHGHFRAIRVFLNFLVRRKIIKHSPLADADIKIRQRWKRPELPNAEKLHRLLTLMKADVFPRGAKAPDFLRLRDYVMVLFYLESGARRSEGLITLDQLDLQFGRAETNQKVRQETLTRPLFFHSVLPALRYYLEERTKFLKARGCEDEKALWVGRHGEALRPDGVTHMFHRIRNRHGWEGKFHPHKLRAVAASLAALGKDRTALEIRMGWSANSPVAKRYIELSQELDAVSAVQSGLSPLRALARLRRPRV